MSYENVIGEVHLEILENGSPENTDRKFSGDSDSLASAVRAYRQGSFSRNRAMTFSPDAPANAPTILVWDHLTVTTQIKGGGTKTLIDDISGAITGGFWAIMGPSGGGKTTLLSTLSLRLDPSKMNISGDVTLNGNTYEKNDLKAMSGYVMQDDLLHADLTVQETLDYTAKLRLSKTISIEERASRISEVMELVGITHVKDVIVGDTRRKGISGGERKRLCISMELLGRPALLFLDEPTSGLDSFTSLSVCSALKTLATLGVCTVVCTIHQPQHKIFDLFDNLILMKKGSIVFQGASKKALLFFDAVGQKMPDGANPADFLIQMISSDEEVKEEDI